jgi:hypothetical protein
LLRNTIGRTEDINLGNLVSTEERQAILQALARWKGIARLASDEARTRAPFGFDIAIELIVRQPQNALSLLRTGKWMRTLAFTPEGQQALAAIERQTVGGTPIPAGTVAFLVQSMKDAEFIKGEE